MQSVFGTLGLLALLCTALPAIAQQSGRETPLPSVVPVQPKNLYPDEAIVFLTPAPVIVASKIKCGPGGDLFATYSTDPHVEVWGSPIRKIALASRHVTEYPIPSVSGYQNVSRSSFDVDPNGVVFALVQARPQPGSGTDAKFVYFIVRYKEDGSLDSYYALELPDRLIQPTSLTMFADGNSLVSGTSRAKDAPASTLGVFSAIFNQTGEYRGQVAVMKPTVSNGSSASIAPKDASPATAQQDAILPADPPLTLGSQDGNIYVLQDEHLRVVSHSGTIEREIDLPAPNKDIAAVQMAAAGVGYLFVFYDHILTGAPGENAERRSMISVANLQTGEITATYRMPQFESNLAAAACGVSINDFVFLSSDQQNNLEVVHYRPK
jgi:hypothetical protein